MARTKSPAIRREPSDIHIQSNGVVHRDGYSEKSIPSMLDKKLASNGSATVSIKTDASKAASKEVGILNVLACVGGIYAS